MSRNNIFMVFILVCIVIGLVLALLPFSDIDKDGLPDSLITEGSILLPVLYTILTLFLLLTRFVSTCLFAPWHCSALLLPPPIYN